MFRLSLRLSIYLLSSYTLSNYNTSEYIDLIAVANISDYILSNSLVAMAISMVAERKTNIILANYSLLVEIYLRDSRNIPQTRVHLHYEVSTRERPHCYGLQITNLVFHS